MLRYLITFTLILLAALSRLLPHPMNFAPITAIALFGGVYLDKKHAFLVPLAAMLISDFFIGFYAGIEWVYGSFAAIGLIGLWLRNHRGIARTVAATLAEMKAAGGFDSAVGTYEKYVQYLRPLNDILSVPLAIIGLKAPRSFRVVHVQDGNRKIGHCEWVEI